MPNLRGTVEIYQGNDTVRRLMSSALARAGFRVIERTGDSPIPAAPSDMLVVDVDSGLPDTDARVSTYAEANRPVLYSGVRASRERFGNAPWIDRPFSKNSFLAQCLGLVEGPTSERITISGEDDPITRELQYEEAVALEKQLGLAPGVLGTDLLDENEGEGEDDVLDLDSHGSAIIEVAEIKSLLSGGKLVGAVAKREVDASELLHKHSDIPRLHAPRTPTFNQTMPDSPLAMSNQDDTPELTTPTESGIVPPPDESETSRMNADIKNVSRMLADSWTRIGTTARTEDRAERIQRILNALLAGGLRSVSQELRRIPAGVGFAGSLEALSALDLLRTVRDRKLRGRLEISVQDGTWVLFVDGSHIEELENLSGSADLQLLDTLYQMHKIDGNRHGELSQGYATGAFHQPASLKLVQDQLVTRDDIDKARVRCVKDAFRLICASRRGNFAFLEVQPGDGQSWPVRGLGQHLDTLLLEVLRESSFDTGDSQATARTILTMDAVRAASLAPTALTSDELAVLRYFQNGEKLGNALEQLSQPEMTAIVNRLKKLELLRRTAPVPGLSNPGADFDETAPPTATTSSSMAPVPPHVEKGPAPLVHAERPDTHEEGKPALPDDFKPFSGPVSNQTVVNPLADLVSRRERRKNASDADNQTTHLKNSVSIGPELDDDDNDDDDEDDLRTDIHIGKDPQS